MKKKLMRSRTDNKVAGVCGGIAEYFNIDVVIVRILWVISAILGGPGLGVYIICAIIIPKEPVRKSYDEPLEDVAEDMAETENEAPTHERYDEYDTIDRYGDGSDDASDYDDYNEKSDYHYDEDNEKVYHEEEEDDKKEINFAYLGIGLMGLGAFLAFKALFPSFGFKYFIPAVLIVGGLLLLNRNKDNEEID